ncbi:hypothetical protein EST38_g662 [Candolleomyces aberdarensis]|uniref:C-factor n=1 Tax=Candolleomyces aberdarensis TaxID=2316362 RepID=A0A4Q2DXC7_9AGAR|nr:hypothetical protein EST38_g662 [Candolleomyces aberdarensis]
MSLPFVLVSPGATRGLGLALTRHFLRTTALPVYTSHRTQQSDESLKRHILEPLKDVDPKRLQLLKLDLNSEDSIAAAAQTLRESLSKQGNTPYIDTAFITGGVLFPEKLPEELDWSHIKQTFQVNVISHLLMIKHFWKFLPHGATHQHLDRPARWIHITARVGSIEDNHLGGWYSYRSSKTALNQVVKTFDLHLMRHGKNALCVGLHPGTVRTDLSRGYWGPEKARATFSSEEAARNLVEVVENLRTEQRGKIWDWAGKEIPA